MSIFLHFVLRELDIMERKRGITVSFGDIAPGGVRRVIKDNGWASDSGLAFLQRPEAEVTLYLQNAHTVTLHGKLEATVDSLCYRCGSTISFGVCERFDYIFKHEQDATHFIEEVEFQTSDIEMVYLDRPEIDLEGILLEQLVLAIPEKLLCKKNCQGICQGCGALLNTEKCSCADQQIDSPFAVLKKLKK